MIYSSWLIAFLFLHSKAKPVISRSPLPRGTSLPSNSKLPKSNPSPSSPKPPKLRPLRLSLKLPKPKPTPLERLSNEKPVEPSRYAFS